MIMNRGIGMGRNKWKVARDEREEGQLTGKRKGGGERGRVGEWEIGGCEEVRGESRMGKEKFEE